MYSYRVHIRTSVGGSELPLHPVEEYMRHVDEYYKILELGSVRGKRRIYLASEDTGVFAEVKKKYFEMITIVVHHWVRAFTRTN